jgi:preprotein translocase subunit YajC
MPKQIVIGDKVVIVGGKYTKQTGRVVKITEKMYAVQLYPSNEVVRVAQSNVQQQCVVYQYEGEEHPKSELCLKRCCKVRMETLAAAREEMKEMRDRINDLVRMLENMTTT